MDFVTHAAFGAVVGRLAAPASEARAARGAMALGALTALAPDADHVLELISAEAYFVHHRTATHSLLACGMAVALAASPLGARLFSRLAVGAGAARATVVAASLASHLLLDVLTPFGTVLLHPFADTRFALDGLPLVAPFMIALSLAGLLAVVRAERAGRAGGRRAAGYATALVLAFCALEFTVARAAEANVRQPTSAGSPSGSPGAPLATGGDRAGSPNGLRRVLLAVPTPSNPLSADVYADEGGDLVHLRVDAAGGVSTVEARPRIRGPLYAESSATARGTAVAALESREPLRDWISRFRVPAATIDAEGEVVWDDLQFTAVSPRGHWPMRLHASAPPLRVNGAESTARAYAVEENPRGPQVVFHALVVLATLLLARRAGALACLAFVSGSLALIAGCDAESARSPRDVPAGFPTGIGLVSPSDDPADWPIDRTRSYVPVVSEPLWVVPGGALPAEVRPLASNNNVAIAVHDRRLFLAFRTSETHFASRRSRIYVLSSLDVGRTWSFEAEVAMGSDVREPCFLSLGGRLTFHWFEAGADPIGFEPKSMWRMVYESPGKWGPREAWGRPGEIPWDMKARGGKGFLTSYRGGHYDMSGPARIELYFQQTTDGRTWSPVDPANPVVYTGGVSEAAFEFASSGDLWAVTRNEDGDASGFGSHVATATAASLGRWTFPARSDPERYDSPEMFRHGEEIFLVARRDVGGPFDMGRSDLGLDARRAVYLGAYSSRPKRTTLYRIDAASRTPVPVVDLPSCGDTCLPSVARLGAHTFLVANYTSPLGNPDRSWIHGQLSPEGTGIYLAVITFVPQ